MSPDGKDAQGVTHAALNKDTPDQVSLSNRGLVSVDLKGVPDSLTSLSLAANALTFVDLRPLDICLSLSAVILNGNKLADLDLAPLANAPRLERLWLHNNSLTQLDLSPLRSCKSLRSLYLDGNKLDKVPLDLSPLTHCGKQLRALRLGRNRLAGELDITPLLSCGSLSTLDTCASVKLTAKTDNAVPAPLPPALRRRAAMVNWVSIGDDAEDEVYLNENANYLGDMYRIDNLSKSSPASLSPHSVRSLSVPPPAPFTAAPAVCPTELATAMNSSCDSSQSETSSLPESESLEELAQLCSTPKSSGHHAVVMVGFRRSCRFSAEALLKEHARLTTAFVASPRASAVEALTAAGALRHCSVFLVRPCAVALVAALRARDGDVPIVVVGSERERDGKCEAAGATCFLSEPLGPRDALIIRSLALQRAKATKLTGSASSSPSCSPLQARAVGPQNVPFMPLASTKNPTPTGEHATPTKTTQNTSPTSTPPTRNLSASGPPPSGPLSNASPSPVYHRTVPTLRVPEPSSQTRSPVRRRGPSRPPTVDFNRLRERVSGATHGRSSRVEESAIGMLFSRCGGRAFPSDFSAIATLCGLPTCSSGVLHAAAKVWSSGDKSASPALSPVSIMSFGECSGENHSPSLREKSDLARSPTRSTSSSICSIVELIDQQDDHQRQADGVSYESFRSFWLSQLRRRDAETRLYNVLRIAYNSEGVVPVAAVQELAASFVASRVSEHHGSDIHMLAASVLCYEIKGAKWNWLRRRELSDSELCSSLLAAESGMYQGVATHLRGDRLADIQMAFAATSGKRVHGNHTLTAKEVTWLNSERGLLTAEAVQSLFAHLPEGAVDIADFAPMWLAVSNPCTISAFEYLFSILDLDADGYVSKLDASHFYLSKRDLLLGEGYIPIAFGPIWQSVADSIQESGASGQDLDKICLSDIRKMSARDATQFFQSLLFVEDELALVDIRETSLSGSCEAMQVVAQI